MSNPNETITIRMSRHDAEQMVERLTHELAGHHNRLEDYVLWGSTERITDAAEAARRTRTLRAIFNGALGL